MIPNNVGLDVNKALRQQLEAYQISFRHWWKKRGPDEFLNVPWRLRCPTGLNSNGWAKYKSICPDDYQWGIFMAPSEQKTIEFGIHQGLSLWHSVPREYHSMLLDHIRIQADAENGAIEQSQMLMRMAPSEFDLRNLLQFLLEEG